MARAVRRILILSTAQISRTVVRTLRSRPIRALIRLRSSSFCGRCSWLSRDEAAAVKSTSLQNPERTIFTARLLNSSATTYLTRMISCPTPCRARLSAVSPMAKLSAPHSAITILAELLADLFIFRKNSREHFSSFRKSSGGIFVIRYSLRPCPMPTCVTESSQSTFASAPTFRRRRRQLARIFFPPASRYRQRSQSIRWLNSTLPTFTIIYRCRLMRLLVLCYSQRGV